VIIAEAPVVPISPLIAVKIPWLVIPAPPPKTANGTAAPRETGVVEVEPVEDIEADFAPVVSELPHPGKLLINTALRSNKTAK
jgi:hypothetical protein